MNLLLSTFLKALRTWHQDKVALIDHRAVAKDVYREGEVSAGYFMTLAIANLIALCGLITNSSPVIIGAMLISPLMGPILSFGYAFITGDKQIWRTSVRKITISVVLTIGIAAMATLFSPLTDLTSEIMSRTRPNLYDLIIAFLAGLVGAVALCTKKNFLTVVPGVAIATAVIPPLSVAGFGAGIANHTIAIGGFLLFFTNLVAIIIATSLIFFFYGFRSRMTAEMDQTLLKKRSLYLTGILLVISIPLAHTLYSSISEVRLNSTIRSALQKEFNREHRAYLNSFTFRERRDALELNVLLNTIDYLKDDEVKRVEEALTKSMRRKVSLNLEQLKVQTGGLKEQVTQPVTPTIVPPTRSPNEILQGARRETIALVRHAAAGVEQIVAPSRINDFSIGFSGKRPGLELHITLQRDQPLSENELGWVRQMFSRELGQPVRLQVTVVPMVAPLLFEPGATSLNEEMRASLAALKGIYRQDLGMRIRIETISERPGGTKQRREAQARLKVVAAFLTEKAGIPAEIIETKGNGKSIPPGTVRVTVLTTPAAH
ncbi:MAG: TIGR00341 family protein [Thermodesulfobacteriota bacterium]